MSSFIDVKYINLLSPKLPKFKRKSDYLFNFRCPHCGDSKKSSTKARGFVYKRKNDMFFKCHNCGEHKSLLDFVKEQAPDLLLPLAAPSETLSAPSESSSSGQKVTKLPREHSVSDNLWWSRHMPRHLYRGNARTIKHNNEDRD